MESKKILRKKFLEMRRAVPVAERDRISHELIKKFLATEFYRGAKILMAYASTPDEIQLNELFAACFADKKILAIPLIVGKGEMRAVEVPSFDSLEVGAFNIPTVKKNLRRFIQPAQIDCIWAWAAAITTDFYPKPTLKKLRSPMIFSLWKVFRPNLTTLRLTPF